VIRLALVLGLIALAAAPGAARADEPLDLATEIARLRGRLAANSAQEQHCLAGATQPIWTAALASDLRALQARATQAASEGSAEAQRWRELARKAEALEARAVTGARAGAELFQSQQIGVECLERFAGEREALRASLEVAVADPAAYGESLGEARAHGTARLRQDLVRLQGRGRALSARWKLSQADAGAGARALKAELADVRRRNIAVLESEPARVMADPTFRAAEALVAAAEAWERAVLDRGDSPRDDLEGRTEVPAREEAARQASEYWITAERLLGRRVP
jgi:hypothetical protein